MELQYINGLAVVGAAVCSFVIGSIWYSKIMFGTPWMVLAGLNEQQIKATNFGKLFGFSFIFQLILASFLSIALSTDAIVTTTGFYTGLIAGLMIFCGIAVAYLFAQKKWTLIFIDGGYQVLALIVMGVIIGFFR